MSDDRDTGDDLPTGPGNAAEKFTARWRAADRGSAPGTNGNPRQRAAASDAEETWPGGPPETWYSESSGEWPGGPPETWYSESSGEWPGGPPETWYREPAQEWPGGPAGTGSETRAGAWPGEPAGGSVWPGAAAGTGPEPRAGAESWPGGPGESWPGGPGESWREAPADSGLGEPADTETDEPAAAEPGKRKRWSFVTEMAVLFTVALVIALLIKSFVVQPFFIPSGSMEDTLLIGDKVLVNKLVYDFRPIGRGDIVVFDGTGSWNKPARPGSATSNPLARVYDDTLGRLFHSIGGLFGTNPGHEDFIKRVIGLPGDHVQCCNARGQITVNGVPLSESSYLYPGAAPSTGRFNIVVPPGRLWVMGDNRGYSADSRLHDCAYSDPGAIVTCRSYDRDGTIPESSVIGRAFLIVWPPSRMQILRVPATFGQPALQHSTGTASAGRVVDLSAAPGSGAPLAAGGIRVVPEPSYIPLAGGFAVALLLMLAVRWLPRRLRRRVVRRGSAPGRR